MRPHIDLYNDNIDLYNDNIDHILTCTMIILTTEFWYVYIIFENLSIITYNSFTFKYTQQPELTYFLHILLLGSLYVQGYI